MRSPRKPAPTSPAPEADAPILGSRVGWVAGFEPGRGVLVDFEGNTRGPLLARSTVPLDASAVRAAVAARQEAVLLFESGDPARPLIMGLVQQVSETPLLDELLGTVPEAPTEPVEAKLDGKRVVLEGKDEIVLKCGLASITLRRNGKIILRGVQLESHASGVNRIKGGSVQIN